MNELILWAAQNTIAALALAIMVYALTRVWRHPATAHVLWVLVLLKLVTPPLVSIGWPTAAPPESAAPPTEAARFDPAPDVAPFDGAGPVALDDVVVEHPAVAMLAVATRGTAEPLPTPVKPVQWWRIAQSAIALLWLGGAAVCGVVTIARIVRFERLLRDTLPAPERCQQLAAEIAARLGVRNVPTVRYAQFAEIPLVWCVGRRPKIVLPIGLVADMTEDRMALILTHELAHLRRRDHWVRIAELLVLTVYWWNPVAWIVRRQIHQAEDLCCDAWVCWAFPDHAHRYAEVIFEAASRPRGRAFSRPALASPFFHSTSLKARIEMILHAQFAPRLSRRSKWLVALFLLVIVPSAALHAKDDAGAGSTQDTSTDQAAAKTSGGKPMDIATLELPRVVTFEQGATHFADGDQIEISEVRGTADKFSPGNIYCIQGTFTLGSHDRASLAAYVTVREAKNATGATYKVQSTIVDKGTGAFTLYLPMNCAGWPHVSFYPTGGGGSFGGNYFGTGDSTLKEWGGEKDTKPAARAAGAAPKSVRTDQPSAKITITSPKVKAVTLKRAFVGTIHSHRHINVRALERGYLEAITIREGQQVKRGDQLFKVTPVLYQKKADAEAAEATLARLKLDYTKKNFADKIVSANEVALREAELQKAQAKADFARAELEFATIKAPFDGIVDRFQHQEGSLVQEGDILTTLSDNSVMWVYFNVSEALYPELRAIPADEMKIELFTGDGSKFDQVGKLGAIEADFNSSTGAIPFRADFPNPSGLLRHGQRGTVQISRALNDALVIPQQSIIRQDDQTYVYVVDKDHVAHRREVTIQHMLEDVAVIKKGGVGPDDKIVHEGVQGVHEGEKVNNEANSPE